MSNKQSEQTDPDLLKEPSDEREYIHFVEDFVGTCLLDDMVPSEVILGLCGFFTVHLRHGTFVHIQEQNPEKFQRDVDLVLKILNILLYVRFKIEQKSFESDDFLELSAENPTPTFDHEKMKQDEKTNEKLSLLLAKPKHLQEAGKRSFFIMYLLKAIDFLVNGISDNSDHKQHNLITYYWSHLEQQYQKIGTETKEENKYNKTSINPTNSQNLSLQEQKVITQATVKFILQVLEEQRNCVLASTNSKKD